MNEDLDTVKTEIKYWEHSFKDTHGHEPTRDDIKANPVIAEKYKVYNKLKKKAQEQSHVKKLPNGSPPSSHPPPCPAPAAIIAIRASPIVSPKDSNTKNPFSPVKQKKHFEESIRTAWNPFMTPVKSALVRTPPTSSSQKPVQVANIPDLIKQTGKYSNTVILKARKRLRGDSVSPSPPQRDKRSRVNGTIANAALLHHSNSTQDEFDDSFFEESPAKPTTNGKAFQPLFNDISSQPSTSTDKLEHRGRAFMKAKTLPNGLFGAIKDVNNHPTEDDFDFATEILDASSKRKGQTIEKIPDGQNNKRKRMLPGPKGLIPDRNNLFDHPSSSANQASSLCKRTISKAAQENTNKPRESNAWSLLPPSPPAQENKFWNRASSKTKKRKLLENAPPDDGKTEESDTETDDIDVVGWHEVSAHRQKDGEQGLEVDPELRIQLRLKSLNNDQVGTESREPETFEIDLPEEMHKMLALSPRNAVNKKEEEDLVRSVMKGRRQGGAEVWGPGEFDRDSEGSGKEEDPAGNDWEGEGIPWEFSSKRGTAIQLSGRMFQHNNVPANEDYLIKGDAINKGEPSFKHPPAAGLPNIPHLPLHLGFDSTSDSTVTTNSQANLSSPVGFTEFSTTSSLSLPQQGLSSSKLPSDSSSSSLSAMIVDEQPHDISRNTRYRLDFHATRSAFGPRGAFEGDYSLHDESPFEAARRAQRTTEVVEDRPKDVPYIPGKTRFPSIKPGELVPAHLIWTIFAPPTFSPPVEAPSFPPDAFLHNPIRPAHFPPGVYESHTQPPDFRAPTQPQPPRLTQSTPPQLPLNPPVNSVDSRPPPRPGPQPSRTASPAHSSRSAPIPQQSQPPPPFLRSNTDTFRQTGSYKPDDGYRAGSLPSLSIPQGPSPPQPRTAPPTRAPSQRQFERPPLPSSLTPGNTLQPPRISSHQPQTPSPLHSGYLPSSNPVRLPSENFRMAQSDHGHDNAPENRGIRSTPKPVMPQLLAPLANTNEKGLANLKRSVSNNPPKGGFLSKTKSLLRKRNSTSTIKLNVDGSIGFNSLATLVEEKDKQSHHRLLKKK